VVRLLFTLALLAAILMVTGVLAVRSDGGREFVRDRIGQALGMELDIERTRIAWPYVLRMEDVRTRGAALGASPGFRAQEARVAPSLRGTLRVEVKRGELNLVRGEDGAWAPGAFAVLGELPATNLAAVSIVTRKLSRRAVLELTDCAIRWEQADGSLLASAAGVTFSMQRAQVPGRRMAYYRLSVRGMTDFQGGNVDDVEREWLASDATPYIELSRTGGDPAADEGFWEARP
jgi:hypothetical protein